MNRGKPETRLDKFEIFMPLSKQRSIQILIGVGFLYIFLVTFEVPLVFSSGFSSETTTLIRHSVLQSRHDFQDKSPPTRPLNWVSYNSPLSSQNPIKVLSNLKFDEKMFDPTKTDGSLELHKSAKNAWEIGRKLWEELVSGKIKVNEVKKPENVSKSCPESISVTGYEFLKQGKVVELPCGLTLRSHITVVGKPKAGHAKNDRKMLPRKDDREPERVSQFMMELQGLKSVEAEDPPRILHFNPRMRGDWSGKPVIEQNTCYRMHWGSSLRCEGWKSRADEETVDGLVKCEKWVRDDDNLPEELKTARWLSRVTGSTKKKVPADWPFPFKEDKLFVLTITSGFEGFHVNVDGRHVTSFPYHTGYTIEDATGLTLDGDIDVHHVIAASLPTKQSRFVPQMNLEMSSRWKAPPLSQRSAELLIGVLSAGNHFAERMAIRKSWMQHSLIRSSTVVARFFVALHVRKEVNLELKKEAEFFDDIVVVPYMDNYDLVVLKTVAICEYGVHTVKAKYIMKGDDDTFVRVDAILDEARNVTDGRSFYIGNINYYHMPMRWGKWAVTYEEWPKEDYPPYANGPGYILSSDIAQFVVSEFENHKLRLFKMEDVSMGMWVEQFNRSKPVEYLHSLSFCQFGCLEGYITAHYQSPRQMVCLWNKLQKVGKPQCCNFR